MMSLENISWHPCCAPELERPKLDRVSTHVGKSMNLNLSWVLIYKKLQIISLFQIRQKLERKSSEEHIYTLLPGKTQPKSENNFLPLPDQTQQKSEDPPLSDITKKLEIRSSEKHRYTPLSVKT